MFSLPSLEVVVTAHREGPLLYATMQSAREAVKALKEEFSIDVGFTIFLDKCDEITFLIAKELKDDFEAKFLVGENGDPGQARLEAISSSNREMIALLDGDDLWSENWLVKSYQEIQRKGGLSRVHSLVFHPEYNLIFGGHNFLVRQGNPYDSFFDRQYLRVGNYWDALCVAPKSVFLSFPYPKNYPELGVAHEDFAWSRKTLLDGVEHVVLKNTIHFKRRRAGSVSVLADGKKAKPEVSEINYY